MAILPVKHYHVDNTRHYTTIHDIYIIAFFFVETQYFASHLLEIYIGVRPKILRELIFHFTLNVQA